MRRIGQLTSLVLKTHFGYTLVEVLVVVIILGVLSTIAVKSLKGINDVTKTEQTRKTLDQLAFAIAGDPSILSAGKRASFGYLGDVGSLPPNLDALVLNPGSYATWHGPYIRDQFTTGGANSSFKLDGWGRNISYSGGNALTSTGGSTTLSRSLSDAVSDLVVNKVTVVVTDLDKTPPGTAYKDSVRIVLNVPNGAGSIAARVKIPDRGGVAQFDSIPIGRQELIVVYLPTSDTVTRTITVEPKSNPYIELSLFRSVW